MPHLVPLYTDARADQQRRGGAGFRDGQASAQIQAVYESLASFESLSRGWSELDATPARPIDPLDEVLLTPRIILEAVAAIGTDAAQEFYRRIAAEPDRAIRCEAARQLARGGTADRDANTAVLRGLCVSDDLHVRISGVVGLWVLHGASDHEAGILAWLTGQDAEAQHAVLTELAHVCDAVRLTPLRPALEDIAADPYTRDHWRDVARRILKR